MPVVVDPDPRPEHDASLQVIAADGYVRVVFRDKTRQTERTIALPKDATEAIQAITLLAGNLARSEADELLRERRANAAPAVTIVPREPTTEAPPVEVDHSALRARHGRTTFAEIQGGLVKADVDECPVLNIFESCNSYDPVTPFVSARFGVEMPAGKVRLSVSLDANYFHFRGGQARASDSLISNVLGGFGPTVTSTVSQNDAYSMHGFAPSASTGIRWEFRNGLTLGLRLSAGFYFGTMNDVRDGYVTFSSTGSTALPSSTYIARVDYLFFGMAPRIGYRIGEHFELFTAPSLNFFAQTSHIRQFPATSTSVNNLNVAYGGGPVTPDAFFSAAISLARLDF